jgi:acetolactate synthase-1/2/3 large subunit
MSLKGPTVVDVVVTRDPAKMLPGVDNRLQRSRKATGSHDDSPH